MSDHSQIQGFTIRVYGLLKQEQKILLSKENIYGGIYLKFPGGGMEFGEGTLECLQREFMEETKLNIRVGKHFYTTEDFVPSAFAGNLQVMSIYYEVHCDDLSPLLHREEISALKEHGDQELIWYDLNRLKPSDLSLPIDQKVVELLKA